MEIPFVASATAEVCFGHVYYHPAVVEVPIVYFKSNLSVFVLRFFLSFRSFFIFCRGQCY